MRSHPMACGVPQGSVLGPLLWNLAYDWVLRGTLLPRTAVICYADDTLIAVRGKTYEDCLVDNNEDRDVGDQGGSGKDKGCNVPRIQGQAAGRGVLPVEPTLKYLGLVLDAKWRFDAHFKQLAPRLISAAAALGRLLPNVGGPSASCRKLYAGMTCILALGVTCGVCGKRPDVYGASDCCNKGAGASWLLCGTGCMFVVGGCVAAVALVYFLAGITAQRFLCDPLTEPRGNRLFSDVDRFVELEKALFNERSDPNFNLSSVLVGCHANHTVYEITKYPLAHQSSAPLDICQPRSPDLLLNRIS
ncbi:hypothetical protein evm_014869 [Chilo suppressalis]|nr:hypothetical protein evm_014869 [Chilo suppressalis]